MAIIDTQIISYALKGCTNITVSGMTISSITAAEFLLIQDSPTKANYYIPISTKLMYGSLNIDHPFSKNSTDQVLINLGTQFPTIIEYSNLALSQVINNRDKTLFLSCIKFLEKNQYKKIKRRFEFLLAQGINCIPLSEKILNCTLQLTYEFVKSGYKTKNKFRNTLNDIFICSTAKCLSETLITEDKELSRFAREQLVVVSSEQEFKDYKVFFIDFQNELKNTRTESKESKGYINQGWQFRLRNYKSFSN